MGDGLKAESFMEVLVFHGRYCAESYSAGLSRLVFQDDATSSNNAISPRKHALGECGSRLVFQGQSDTEFDSISQREPDRSGLVFQDLAFSGRAAVVVGGSALRSLDDSFGNLLRNPDWLSAIGANRFLDHRRRLDFLCASVAVYLFFAGVGIGVSNRPFGRFVGLSHGPGNEVDAGWQ